MGAAMGATIIGSTCMADACGTIVTVLVTLSAAIRDGGELLTGDGASGHLRFHAFRHPHVRITTKNKLALEGFSSASLS